MPEIAERSVPEMETAIAPKVDKDYVVTPYIRDLAEFALANLKADFPVHFCGSAGTGKSALALYVACLLKRPIVLIHGDAEFGTSDLVGGEMGFSSKRVRDQYIHSVIKVEEDVSKRWVDFRLTTASRHGFTLVYDEFTRSKPEANNVLLAVLEERMLDMPTLVESEREYIQVHPKFRAIFTSNPEEYAGIYKAQDALRDRLVTINLGHFDRETEIAITKTRSGASEEVAEKVVDLVRDFRKARKEGRVPTVREAIKIARALVVRKERPSKKSEFFKKLCLTALTGQEYVVKYSQAKQDQSFKLLDQLIRKHG